MIVVWYLVRWCLGLTHGETQTTEAERDCIARRAVGRRRLAEIGVTRYALSAPYSNADEFRAAAERLLRARA